MSSTTHIRSDTEANTNADTITYPYTDSSADSFTLILMVEHDDDHDDDDDDVPLAILAQYIGSIAGESQTIAGTERHTARRWRFSA